MRVEFLVDSSIPPSPPLNHSGFAFLEPDARATADFTDRILRLKARYANLPPEDRISSPTEPQEPQQEVVLPSNQEYLDGVNRLQSFWDQSLGKSEPGIKNYNPVLERAKYESLEDEEQKEQFRGRYSFNQIEKALRERFNVAVSSVIYDFDENGKLISRDMPDKPFETVLDIGIEYYQKENPQDVPRMVQERRGFVKIQDRFYKQYKDREKKPDIQADVISGKGMVEGTIFIDNFLDRWELIEDPLTKLRYVQMSRFTTDTTYDQYKEMIATKLPGYPVSSEIPIDEHYLANPIFNKEGLLIQRATSLNEEEFQQVVKDGETGMKRLGEEIAAQSFNPRRVAEILNTVLNGADFAWARIMKLKDKVVDSLKRVVDKISSWAVPVFRTFEERVDWFKRIVVRPVAAGCGLSGGYSLGGGIVEAGIALALGLGINLGAAAGFLEKDERGSLYFPCPHKDKGCYKVNKRPKGQLINYCGEGQAGGCGRDVKC